jgi:AraC-like DNA-binding protein
MNDSSLYKKAIIESPNFPIRIAYGKAGKNKDIFQSHWHEQLEFLYFTKGNAYVECNSVPVPVSSGDLIVVNANELHFGRSLNTDVEFTCIIIDPTFLKGSFTDICEIKYLTPINRNLILFENKISNDVSIEECIKNIAEERSSMEIGLELAIKAHVNWLLVLLLRSYIKKVLTIKEYNILEKNITRLNKILKYIEENYFKDHDTAYYAQMACMSKFHFCHVFKNTTGKTLTEYINSIRINKAEHLLKNASMNITQIAMEIGFNDVNYFSRIFKKVKNFSPSYYARNCEL